MTQTAALSPDERALHAAVVDTLLPGDGDWPSAGALGIADEALRIAALARTGLEPLRRLLAALPAAFAGASADAREAALRAASATEPAGFGSALQSSYNAYYTHPDVLGVVKAKTGYRGGSPQPDGYQLPPFDEAMIAVARTREPLWRKA